MNTSQKYQGNPGIYMASLMLQVIALAASAYFTSHLWNEIEVPVIALQWFVIFPLIAVFSQIAFITISFAAYKKGGFKNLNYDSEDGLKRKLLYALTYWLLFALIGMLLSQFIGDLGIALIVGGAIMGVGVFTERTFRGIIIGTAFIVTYALFGWLIGGMVAWLTLAIIPGWKVEFSK